jgi:hypothetical protein
VPAVTVVALLHCLEDLVDPVAAVAQAKVTLEVQEILHQQLHYKVEMAVKVMAPVLLIQLAEAEDIL